MFYCRLDNASLAYYMILAIYLYYLYFIYTINLLFITFVNFEILCNNNNNKYPIIYLKINDTLSNSINC